jgi:hypothetical protein
MLNPTSLEFLVNERIHAYLAQAAQDALADQLPRSPAPRPDVVARQFLASGLRVLAARLDPCMASETGLVVASPR